MENDEALVEAEILEETPGEGLALISIVDEYTPPPMIVNAVVPMPIEGNTWISISFEEEMAIREALAFYHDHGPRGRNTYLILNTLRHVADQSMGTPCPQCDNTGKYLTMYRMEFCHCWRGVQRREEG